MLKLEWEVKKGLKEHKESAAMKSRLYLLTMTENGIVNYKDEMKYKKGLKIMLLKEYADKVRACWLGKNIGGSLGAPTECKRGVWDLDYYLADLSKGALPNDDLDLQLVWLNAVERYGKAVKSEILGEYWLSYIVANWSEYGAGKNNMAMGLLPPISGWYHNHNKDSCGCFIRSEIWACLMPGHPELAVKYAFEDAICDHADEGVYAEIFCAAVESAAFCEADRDTLIDIGLSYIPPDCAISRAVHIAMDCHKKGLDWKAARKVVLTEVPGSFGMYAGYQDREDEGLPVGPLGFDAPSNIGLTMLGWLYGEGDFGRSICIAAGCGEDGDCTAATLGSILGILSGTAGLPEKWTAPIGDEIKTISIDLTNVEISVPKTISELTDRVVRQMPVFMGKYCDILSEGGIVLRMSDSLRDGKEQVGVFAYQTFSDRIKRQPLSVTKENVLYEVTMTYGEGILIRDGQEMKFTLQFKNKLRKQQWSTARLYAPEDWQVSPGREWCICLDQRHGGCALTQCAFTLTPGVLEKGRYDLVLEFSSNGRLSRMYFPITLLVDAQVS